MREGSDEEGVSEMEAGVIAGGGQVMKMVGVGRLAASPFQPRQEFGQVELDGLAESIRQHGVMIPILVREVRAGSGAETATAPQGGTGGVGGGTGGVGGMGESERNVTLVSDELDVRYEIIAGERRLRAAKLAGLEKVPVLIARVSDLQAAEWSLVENVQREDLNPVDEALGLENLSKQFGLTQVQIADQLGLDRTSVSNAVRLLALEPEVLTLLARGARDGGITEGHAKVLLGMQPGAARVRAARAAAEGDWSVRAVTKFVKDYPDAVSAGAALDKLGRDEKAIGGATSGGAGAAGALLSGADDDGAVVDMVAETEEGIALRARVLQVASLERELADYLGTKVEIRTNRKGSKGKLVIWFYGVEQFEGLREKMMARRGG